jgi:predicted acylesterase/phospholipase RssA
MDYDFAMELISQLTTTTPTKTTDWRTSVLKCEKCLTENKLNDFDEKKSMTELKEKLAKNPLLIENLCFSGGGVRCVGYAGAILVLEELGLLTHIKRIAGASGGAITALLVVLGYSASEINKFVCVDQSKYMDRSWSYMTWWYYLLFGGGFGIYRGKVLEDDLKSFVNTKFDRDFPDFRKSKEKDYQPTFQDLYTMYKKELIVPVTNDSRQVVEFFCPKLTPNMPLYLAVRMSASIPGFFESITYNGCRYIDGGMAENYPLDVFCTPKYIFLDVKEPSKKDVEKLVFDRTLGFTLVGSGIVYVIDDKDNKDSIVSNVLVPTSNAYEYGTSIIDFWCTQNSEDVMTIVNLLNPNEPHSFLKHSIKAYTPCITTTDFNASEQNKNDTMCIFKYKTIKFLLNKVNQRDNDNVNL